MFGTYAPGDVTLLLKDITGLVEPQPAAVREALIQSGVHYCEMLPLEYRPSALYMQTYERALALNRAFTARAAAAVAEAVYREKGERAVLVSLARAGTPIGILLKHWIRNKHGVDLPHYAISIIRGRGIDRNAMSYISNSGSLSDAVVKNAMLANFDARYPVGIAISSTTTGSGHSIVADGYGYSGSSLYIHLNMGWGGGTSRHRGRWGRPARTGS